MHTLAFSIFFSLVIIATICSSSSIGFTDDVKISATQPTPSTGLAPGEVVVTVIRALAENDANDTGIRTAWKFASTNNKMATGPIERFIPMVKSPAYAPLINHKAAVVREIAIKGNEAAELAIITDANGNQAFFIFQLSIETEGSCKGCWMTDGVLRVEPPKPQPPERNPADGSQPA